MHPEPKDQYGVAEWVKAGPIPGYVNWSNHTKPLDGYQFTIDGTAKSVADDFDIPIEDVIVIEHRVAGASFASFVHDKYADRVHQRKSDLRCLINALSLLSKD